MFIYLILYFIIVIIYYYFIYLFIIIYLFDVCACVENLCRHHKKNWNNTFRGICPMLIFVGYLIVCVVELQLESVPVSRYIIGIVIHVGIFYQRPIS